MTMPIDLFWLRHGQSVGNKLKEMAKRGDMSAFTQEVLDTHSSKYRLTKRGVEQARAAGRWLRENGYASFDRCYVSAYVRAMETAAHLGLEGARWYAEPFLRERDYGLFDVMPMDERKRRFPEYVRHQKRDGIFWSPPGGESIADALLRADRIFHTLHREADAARVIVVCHGETMWAARMRLERMTLQRFESLHRSKDPKDRINNCQIIQYTRQEPGSDAPPIERYGWMRSVCPTDLSLSSNDWVPIVRPTFSDEDLLALVEGYPHLIDDL